MSRRYIDAEFLRTETERRIKEANESRMAIVDSDFLDLINDAPTEDVVEVVRCRDCLFANTEDGKIKCHNTYGLLVTEEKNYCSRGRRRDDV